MKPVLLLMVCSAFGISAIAQEFKVDIPKIMKHSDILKQYKTPNKSLNKDSLLRNFHDFYTSKHDPGIYDLPQDNMPCVVPDTNGIAVMPNAWSDQAESSLTSIPNPGIRKKPQVERSRYKTK